MNCSAPHYNLGASKCADWLRSEGYEVETANGDPGMFSFGYDVVALSVIFSWHAPIARDVALRVCRESEVWCGGPGMTAIAHWWTEQTGLTTTLGLDQRFESQRGSYRMTFASRGCPVGCWFCIVPKLEGKTFTLNWDFTPAPILCDNNLSALPAEFQDHILQRYRDAAVKLGDANSGFEPRAFTEETYERWRKQLIVPWRFAYDELGEREDVLRMMQILAGERARRKQVYVLVGNEPIAECYERAMQVIAWGGEPYCQYVRPLNWLGDPAALRHRHDWTEQSGRDFARFFNRRLWRSLQLSEYRPRLNEPLPFRALGVPLAA
ncbi:MAG: hypothetical protein ACR2M1_05255 [Gemmatimonadaceae bacterium]